MNAQLINTARANRIAALAYLAAKKERESSQGEVLCLAAKRAQLRAKTVVQSRRTQVGDERVAA